MVDHWILNKFLVSKETAVLRRWERSKQKFGFIKRVEYGEISKSFTVVISPLSTRLMKPNFCTGSWRLAFVCVVFIVGTNRNPSWKSLLERATILFSKSAFCNALTFQTHKCFFNSMLTFVTNIRVLIELAQTQPRPPVGRLCGVCLPLLLTVCVDLNNKRINRKTETMAMLL
mgnify:CR=1 FL=1